jgi:hypothetical protein
VSGRPLTLDDAGAGLRFARLILEPASWVTRRVETLRHLDSGETRRAISLDVTLPAELAVQEHEGTVLVPLAMLAKRPLTALDVRDQAGSAVSVLDRMANARWSTLAVRSILTGQFPQAAALDQLVSLAVHSPPEAAQAAVRRLHEQLRVAEQRLSLGQEVALELLDDLATQFVLIAEMPQDVLGRRRVVKFAYDEPVGRSTERWWANMQAATRAVVESPAVGDAASYHLELVPPTGVSAGRLAVTRVGPVPQTWEVTSVGPRVHLNVRDSVPGARYRAFAELRPRRSGTVNYAANAGWMAAAVLLGGALAGDALRQAAADQSAAAAAAAVLVVPAFLLALLLRPSEHPLASRVYFPARLAIALTASILVAGSAVLVLSQGRAWLTPAAWALAGLQFLVAAYGEAVRQGSDPRRTLPV